MFLCQVDVCRAAACCHERLSFLNLLLQFLGFAAYGLFRTVGNLDYVVEAYRLQCTIYMLYRLAELCQHCRGNHCYCLFSCTHALEYIEYLAFVEYRTERACVEALSAVYALLRVYVFYAVFVL